MAKDIEKEIRMLKEKLAKYEKQAASKKVARKPITKAEATACRAKLAKYTGQQGRVFVKNTGSAAKKALKKSKNWLKSTL